VLHEVDVALLAHELIKIRSSTTTATSGTPAGADLRRNRSIAVQHSASC